MSGETVGIAISRGDLTYAGVLSGDIRIGKNADEDEFVFEAGSKIGEPLDRVVESEISREIMGATFTPRGGGAAQ